MPRSSPLEVSSKDEDKGAKIMSKEFKKLIIHEVTNCRSKKLRSKMLQLLKLSSIHAKDLKVQQAIDDFYYMQKQQELETLEDKLKDSISQTMMYVNLLQATYEDASFRWKRDFVTMKRLIGAPLEVKSKENV